MDKMDSGVPNSLVSNVKSLMNTDENGARYYIQRSIETLTRSYALTGPRFFLTQVDAQVAVYLLDGGNAKYRDFRDRWGQQLVDDVEDCDAWLSGVLTASQSQAVQNLPYWLAYALQTHRKWADWERHAQVFANQLPVRAASYLVSPILKRVLDHLEDTLPLALNICERKGVWTDVITDAHRVARRTALYENCVDQLDYSIVNILFDALLDGDVTLYADAHALLDRLTHMRHYTKSVVAKRLKQKQE